MAGAGLYDPRFEHDACGVGFVADLSGRGGHDVVARALRVLCNLEHRGAKGGDPGTGDGAGILTQIPDEFFRASCSFDLPEAGAYAAGMAFFSAGRHLVTPALARLAAAEGLVILGWREVPFDITACGDGARAVLPDVLQLFVAGAEGQRGMELERMAFCLRKRAEHEAGVYFASLSCRYWNPVDRYGVPAFARDLAAAGGSGLITPDLTIEESGAWLDAAAQHNLDRVFLVAPSSTGERIAQVTRVCRGFVYAASLMGITGTRDAVSSDAPGLVARTREHTDLPVAVGLGVSNGAQAAQVAAFADGVIVGSAFVRRLLEADGSAATAAIADLTAELREGVTRKTR